MRVCDYVYSDGVKLLPHASAGKENLLHAAVLTCCFWSIVLGQSVATLRDQYAQNKVTAICQTSWKPTSQTITPIFCRELPVLRV